jgi:xanthosine utilization system XapX-like protein
LLIVATLMLGLAADIGSGFLGQATIGAAFWGVLFYLLGRLEREERAVLMLCLLIATTGEMALSLGWGLYVYRLGNIPLFVPPGHALMLLLGMWLARRVPAAAALAVMGCAAAYTLVAAVAGADTLGVLLFIAFAAAFAMRSQRRLYAATFVLALGLELYGTWLGNWRWAREVPGVALVTTNPPGASGAFYSVLDALVAATASLIARRPGARKTAPKTEINLA